jgi:hypothetical protein
VTTQKQLQGLAKITALALDQRLVMLRQAQAARQSIAQRIASLDLAPVPLEVSLVAAQKADVMYSIWADQRRVQLNLQLAQASAVALQAEADARLVFAKDSVLAALSARLSTPKK